MWFSTLTYPVEQPYRLRWITEIFYFGSCVLVALLIVFNFALVGYDDVTVLSKDPNITDYDQWWAPKSLPSMLRFNTKPGDCQEATLPLNTPLRTNSSLPLFTYSLIHNIDNLDPQKDSFGLPSETPYQANPMNICHVQSMELTMEPRIVSVAIDTKLVCDPVGKSARSRMFQTQFNTAYDSRLRPDTIMDYLSVRENPNNTESISFEAFSHDGPPKNSYSNVLGVIDGLSTDLIRMMFMRQRTYNSSDGTRLEAPEIGSMAWDPKPDSRPLTETSRLSWSTYTGGWWIEGDEYLGSMNITITNLLIAIHDAIHLDMGNIALTNIYTDKAAFNSLIKADDYDTELMRAMGQYYGQSEFAIFPVCSWGWGCLDDYKITWARAFTSTDGLVNNITLPIHLPSNRTASVLDIIYLCPIYKRKPLGSLLISLFVGTFTMYVTLYGIFAWLAPALDRKRKGPQFSERFITQQLPSSLYELHHSPSTPQGSSYAPPYYALEYEDDGKRLLDEEKEGRS